MAAPSSGAGHQRRLSVPQMPTRPPGEYITKATKISPNQSSQFGVQIENNSRNRIKNNAPSAGPSMLRMPPITTIANSSPENGTETASAETREGWNASSAPASPVTTAEITKIRSL